MKLLKQLYEIHSPNGKEKRMQVFIKDYLSANIPEACVVMDRTGNLYITKGDAENYPCVAAHLNQVQKLHSKDFRAVETPDIIFGYSTSKRRMEGLGADDKNGIWIALQCLKKYDTVKVAFFVGEEVGCSCTKVYTHPSESYSDEFVRWDSGGKCFQEEMIFDIMRAHPDYTALDAWEVYSMNFPEFTCEKFVEMYEEYCQAYGIKPLTALSKTNGKAEKEISTSWLQNRFFYS